MNTLNVTPEPGEAPWFDQRGASLIAEEQRRVRIEEAYSLAHDQEIGAELLVAAAMAYLTGSMSMWPWASGFKPGDRLRDLIKAGQFIASAIDVLRTTTPAT